MSVGCLIFLRRYLHVSNSYCEKVVAGQCACALLCAQTHTCVCVRACAFACVRARMQEINTEMKQEGERKGKRDSVIAPVVVTFTEQKRHCQSNLKNDLVL